MPRTSSPRPRCGSRSSRRKSSPASTISACPRSSSPAPSTTPQAEEVLIGATVTLTAAGGQTLTAQTDAYGDFWFEGIDDGLYDLEIKSGKKTKKFKGLDTTVADINLGDIALA